MRTLFALVSCVAVLAASRPAWGAQGARLKPGARVRLDARSLDGRLTGTLVAVESDTLFVREDGQAEGLRLLIPVDSVTRIDVFRERRMTLEGVTIGLLGGTLLALVASPNAVDEDGNCTIECLAYQISPKLDTRIAVLGGVGALVGVIVGSETRTRSWTPVALKRLDVGPAPGGGLALGVRISIGL